MPVNPVCFQLAEYKLFVFIVPVRIVRIILRRTVYYCGAISCRSPSLDGVSPLPRQQKSGPPGTWRRRRGPKHRAQNSVFLVPDTKFGSRRHSEVGSPRSKSEIPGTGAAHRGASHDGQRGAIKECLRHKYGLSTRSTKRPAQRHLAPSRRVLGTL